MRTLRLSVVVVALACLSCGGKTPKPGGPGGGPWSAPDTLGHIPADTPYAIASLRQVDEKTRRYLMDGVNGSLRELLRTVDKLREGDPSTLEPWMRAALVVGDELRGKPESNWMGELGFHPQGRFAFYGLSVWPVVRLEVANQGKLRSLVERSLKAAGIQLKQGTLDGRNYWIAGTDKFAVVAAVLEREAVIALLPTSIVPTALPFVLGTERPAQNLATTRTIPELLARHRFIDAAIGLIDTRSAVDIVSGRRNSPFDAPLKDMTGPVPPACRTDLERMAGVVPRMVFGYRQLDAKGFDGMVILETPPSVVQAMTKLRAAAPEVVAKPANKPLFAMGAAMDPSGFLGWLGGVANEIRSQPFTCPWFQEINNAGGDIAKLADQTIPPMFLGVRGVALTIDSAVISPRSPSVEGHVVVSGDRIVDLVSMAAMGVPQLKGIHIKPDGKPVALPLDRLGLPIGEGHAVLTNDRLVVAAGKASSQRAVAHTATPAPASSPLFTMSFDVQRLMKLLESIGSNEDMESLAHIGTIGISFDVGDTGLVLQAWGTWHDTPPAAAP